MRLSENYTLLADGQPVNVYHTKAGDFAIVCFSGSTDITVTTKKPFHNVTVRPLRANHKHSVNGSEISLRLSDKDKVSVEPYGLENPLFILCSQYIPKPCSTTHVYDCQGVTEIGTVELKSNDRVYIEKGAIVVGNFVANGAKNIEITGNGIIWGLPYLEAGKKYRTILQKECENVTIRGITIADSPSWNVVPTGCKNVTIVDVNVLGVVMSTDAFDVVGCENVTITRCFACVNDDCVAIKACHYNGPEGARSVKNVTVTECVFWKLKCGNALEIGFETSGDEICRITFESIDIIHSEHEGWQSGAVFSIHNGDRANVHNVKFKDIYIEDAHEKLIDLKILVSKYSTDDKRGHINDITFDGIYVLGDVLPPSIIRGYEPDSDQGNLHTINDITVRNLYLNGEKVVGKLNAHAVVELSTNVIFE
ncbi:MAG: glycosyl hydrolase family 28 protein [Firmicutes bacterium]|nr:glycosyl hydrolase family 28 protein [Bacillota bacterium]